VVEVFEAMHLLFIKVLHLVRCYNLIVVEIDDFEPVAYTAKCCLIFLAEHEPHEVLIIHLVFLFTFEFARHLIEYSVNCLATQRVALVTREILLINKEVMIRVQLPKAAIQHVKMLIREVLAHHIYIVLVAHLLERLVQV